jgi:PKD repeat protein
MRRFILLFALVCILMPVFSSAQTVQEMWTARYNGTGNNYDEANAIAVDQSGNVYVAGESKGSSGGLDYVTMKYDCYGNVLWSARYNGPGNGDDKAHAVVIDNNGNVFVTGESRGNGSSTDYATVKYDTNGNQLWVARYDGPAGSDDMAHGIALDGNSNVVVTGESKGNSTGFDYATIKYNANGSQLWVKRYNGPVSFEDSAYAVAIDVNGNIYITGESKGSQTCLDFATLKYDTNGNQLWVRRSNNPSNSHDSAYSIAVDSSRNVYVTGKSKSSTYHYDYMTIKYDSGGNEQWLKRYNGTGNGDDSAYAVAVDGSGYVYVTGESDGYRTDKDYVTIKYDANGNEVWIGRYNGPGDGDDSARAIAVDSSGNVYVTGESKGSGSADRDYATMKYDTNGNVIWVARYNGPANNDDTSNAIAVDASGYVYVTGRSEGNGTNIDYLTIKYGELKSNFTGTPTSGYSPLNVQFADNSTGNISNWSWNFGDGGTSTAQSPSHMYNTSGTFTVTLTVTGPGGSATETKTDYIHVSGEAAPVANFSSNVTGGSRPLTVNFTDGSTGSVTSWSWNFGDGGTSTQQNPSHIYTSTGTFTVTLTVTGPGGTDAETKTGYITCSEALPSADFTGTPTTGYRPLTVQFTDSSTGSITGRSWTFGDGGTSTQQNPSHTYNSTGTYTVSLTVTGPGGSDTETKTGYIVVTEAVPVANFSGTPTSGNKPLTVNFTDGSTGSITSWSWTFGDGGTSTQQNPSHTYNSTGTFTVALTVTGPGGTNTKTVNNYITVSEAAPDANFSGTPTTGNRPMTVQFTDSSTGNITSRSWTFGDGGASTALNPSHTYTSAGTFTVALTATGPGGSDTETKTGYIVVTEAAPVANFSGTPTTGYKPLTVNFTDGSTGNITSRSWTFGDGGTSTQQNPSHIYTSTGTYTVSLTVTGPGGTDTKTMPDYISVSEAAPVAGFNGTPTNGYMPLTVNFTDVSTGSITSRSWTFGDGGTSTQQNPSHIYNSTGIFTVTLTVTGPGGTDTQTKTGYINVNDATKANFSGTPTNGYRPLTVQFSDSSTGGVTGWSWDFGDGGTSTAQNPSHIFNANGTYSVSLTVTGPGGSDAETKTGYIVVTEAPPVSGFSGTPTTGNRPMTVQFTDSSTGSITSRSWTFGDGGTSTAQNPSHTYNSTGTFTVALTVTGPGGSDTETKTGYIVVTEAAAVANFSSNAASGYRPLTVNFTDDSTGNVTSWSWSFGDGGTSTAQNPSHTYTGTGTFTVSLTVTGPGGTDTKTMTDYISVTEAPPVAGFSGTPTTGNRPLNVQFTESSTGSITSRSWTFGDGGTSTAQNPSHTYNAAGTYTVSLTVTGPGGSDTETKAGYIVVTEAAPVANFSGTPASGYKPLTVQFTDGSTGNITSRSWTFGDGGTSTVQNPSHIYNANGTYSVSLTVTGPGGSDTETKTGYIVVTEAAPTADFSGTPTSGYKPLTVQFTDSSTGSITSRAWTFGDGGTSTQQNPSHAYNATGTYTVSLTVTGPGGSDTETKTGFIVVSDAPPLAKFSADKISGYKPLSVNFTDESTGNINGWSWHFGDGGSSTAQNPSHTYSSTGCFDVALTVTGPGGTDTLGKTDYICVSDSIPAANFSANTRQGNKPLAVMFGDSSTGNITDWLWDFGDGSTSTDQNPSHTYSSAGTFTVTLTVTGPGGSDSEIKTGYISVTVCNVQVPKDYPTIQRAIDAVDNGCTILVSSGNYLGNINFQGKSVRVKAVGTSGFCNCSSDLESKVTIFGGYHGSVVTFNSGETRDSVLEGFTIKNGMSPLGGGIYIENASPTIRDCYIYENNGYEEGGTGHGGGVAIVGSNSSPLIFNSLIFRNAAQDDLGGSNGGGIYVSNGANPTIQNCTIVDNFANFHGGGVYVSTDSSPVIVDSIIWNNNTQQLYCGSGCGMDVRYSNIGETVSGIGNISSDPLFVPGALSTAYGNYYLSHVRAGQGSNSPCIDAGSDLARNLELDIRNTANDGITDRGTVDMGYHFTPTPIYIQDAVTLGGTRGQSITYSIVYRIEGSPETKYKVIATITVKGAYKYTVTMKEKHYPGVYTMHFTAIVPSTAVPGTATVTYKTKLKQAGKTELLGTDVKTSQFAVK